MIQLANFLSSTVKQFFSNADVRREVCGIAYGCGGGSSSGSGTSSVLSYKDISTNYAATPSDYGLRATATLNLTLPSPTTNNGQLFQISTNSSGVVTLLGASITTSNFGTVTTINQGYTFLIQSNGSVYNAILITQN